MGKSCCAINCTNRFLKNSGISFYRLPKCKERRSKWIAAIRRSNWQPGAETWICSHHFVSGKKSDDPLHPDYTPCLFSFTSITDKAQAVDNLHRYLQSHEEIEDKCESIWREQAATALLNLHQASEPEVKAELQSTEVQTEETSSDIESLHQQIKSLNCECQSLRNKVYELESKLGHTLDPTEFDDNKMKFFTGLPNVQTFMLVFSFVSSVLGANAKQSLKPTQELLLTLMKLRLNISREFIGYLFRIHQSTVSRIFHRWIHVLAERLTPLILWPEREDLQLSLPMCYQSVFRNVVSIIDFFEVLIERPSDLQARAETWSNNKQHNTIKFLISMTPKGSISFVSKGWGGHVANKHLIEHSGFLDKLLPGDAVLADRGFTLEDCSGLFCAELETLPFTQEKKQLSPKEIEIVPEYSTVRTHVKKLIGMVRQKYTILAATLPMSLIGLKQNGKVEDSPVDKIVFICCALSNLCENTITSDELST